MSLNIGVKINVGALKQSLSQAASALGKFFGNFKRQQVGIGGVTPAPGMAAAMGKIPAFNPQQLMQGLNPKALQTYTGSMMNLNDMYGDLTDRIEDAFPSMKTQGAMFNIMDSQFNRVAETIAKKASPEFKFFADAMRKAGYQGQLFGKNFQQIEKDFKRQRMAQSFGNLNKAIGSAFGNIGKKMSWFGFRLTMMGRMITRELAKPIKKSMQLFMNWDKTISSVGTAMGMLGAFGLMNADRMDMMNSAMRNLPKTGMMVQGMFGAIQALMINLGADVLPMIIPPILDLVDALSRLWSENKSKVLPVLQELIDTVFPALIDILNESGGAMIDSFVSGLSEGIVWMKDFLVWIEPLIPALAGMFGKIVGLAPIMSMLGTVLFSLSVPLQLIGYLFGGLGGILSSIIIWAWILGISFTTVAIAFAALAIIIGTIILHFDELKASIMKNIMPAVTRLKEAWSKLTGGIFDNMTMMGFLKGATTPVLLALKIIIKVIGAVIEVLAFLMNTVKAVIDILWALAVSLGEGFMAIPNIIGAVIDSIKELADEFNILGKISDWLFGNSIGSDIKEQMAIAKSAFAGLRSESRLVTDELKNMGTVNVGDMGAFATPIAPTPGTQTVSIVVEMNIESVTSDVDIDAMAEEVSRRIAEKVR